jgi:hypothetical protein
MMDRIKGILYLGKSSFALSLLLMSVSCDQNFPEFGLMQNSLLNIMLNPAPSALNFPENPYIFLRDTPVTLITPTVNGKVTSCTAGLTLASDCSISGTPTEISDSALYTITAMNPYGSTTAGIDIAVNTIHTVVATYPGNGTNITASKLRTLSVSFSREMNTNTVTINSTDTACNGSIQLSNDDFLTCFRLKSLTYNSARTKFSFKVHPDNPITAGQTGIKFRVTTAAEDTLGNAIDSQFTSTTGFSAK